MRRFAFIAWWSLMGSSTFIAFFDYLQPATFSSEVFSVLVGLTCVAGAIAIAHKRYE